jgi:DNA helicase-2/ATP-dependent DNA helicase PcrA
MDSIDTDEDFYAFVKGEKKMGSAASWKVVANDLKEMFELYYNTEENALTVTAKHISKALETYTKAEWENGVERIEDYEAVWGMAEEFETPGEMLEEIALQEERANESKNRVLLSSIHGVKGLEFKVVLMMAMNEGIFPSSRAETIEEIAEERRLAYVGFTRAMDVLIMYAPTYQATPGRLQGPLKPSRFLGEVRPELLRIKTNT